MTHYFSNTSAQMFCSAALSILNSKFAEICYHLFECIICLAFEIFEIHINSQFPGLKNIFTQITTYLISIHRHKPINHILKLMNAGNFIFASRVWSSVSEMDSRNSFVFPTFTKLILIVEKRKFFNYVVHYQVDVNTRFISNVLFECFAKLTYLRYIKPLVRVQF